MDSIQVETTQNITIDYEVASVGDRIVATIIDNLIMASYLISIVMMFNAHINDHFNGGLSVVAIFLCFPLIFYHLLAEIFMNGQSFGKKAMKIKVVKLDGTQATLGAYFLRWLIGLVERGLIGFIAVLASGKGQRLGDMAAGTTVIKLKSRVKLKDTILNQVVEQPNYIIVFSEVSKLSDKDIAIIKEVMDTAQRTYNWSAIEQLAAKIKEVMGVYTNLSPMDFLNTVLKDYNHYNFGDS